MPATTLATTTAITAVTTMNKPIQAKSESVGAKPILNSLREKSSVQVINETVYTYNKKRLNKKNDWEV